MNLNLTANSIGERIVVALAVLGLVAEMLSDNGCTDGAQPMKVEVCQELCWSQDQPVKKVEAWTCECAQPGGE